MLTSAACTVIFPDHFHLNTFFLGCLLLMCIAVFLYENKNIDVKQMYSDLITNEKARMRVIFAAIVVIMFVIGISIVSYTNVAGGVDKAASNKVTNSL